MILGICNNPDILKVIMYIKLLINAIRVVVPILLIVTCTITFMQAVYSDKEDIGHAKKVLVTRAIAAAAIFFVPTLVNVVISATGVGDIDICMELATPQGISGAYTDRAERYISIVKDTLSKNDYFNAQTAISRVDDEVKDTLNQELEVLKPYVDLMSQIDALTEDYTYEKFKDIKSRIDAVSAEEIKAKLEAKFDEVKEALFAFIGDYPIVPFGEHELYTGLKYFKYDTLSNLLEKNGSSVEELNEKIKMAVEYYGVGTRKATVAAAITLIGSVAETGYQLPYYWGGKRDKLGVDGTWGTFKDNEWCNDYYFDTQERIDYCKQHMSYWAMDCSGFVNWAIVQGTQKEQWQSETNRGTKIKLGASTADHAVCDIGDALETDGHIVLVVGLDDENNRYIIAEESSGLEIDSKPYHGEHGAYWCEKLDHNYVD